MNEKIIKFNVAVPTDEGFIGRKCKAPECGRYFKVKLASIREEMFCPYCGVRFSKEELTTGDQKKYFKEVTKEKAKKYMYDEVDKIFGELARKPQSKNVIFKHNPINYREKTVQPKYRELQVDSELTCSECNFLFQVYGIFGYCPGCHSENIWIYDANFAIIQKEISTNPDPQRALRHAYSDLVSTFEIFCRKKAKTFSSETTRFQVLFDTRNFFKKNLGIDILNGLKDQDILALRRVFQKRHILEHNAGIINENYVRMIPEDAKLLNCHVELSNGELKLAAETLRIALDNLSRAVE